MRDGVIVERIAPLGRDSGAAAPSSSPTTRCSSPGSSTRTCTSTSRGAPSGRASSRRPGRPPPAASRRSSTCRSTASRRRFGRRARREARGGRGRRLRRRRVLGRRRPRQPRRPRAARRGRRLRVQVLPRATPASTSSRRSRVDEMEAAMAVLAEARLAAHRARRGRRASSTAAPHPHSRDYADFLASRPRAAEDAAIAAVIERAARTGARAHILHLSDADALDRIAAARRHGVRLTVETCPHYLTLARRGRRRRSHRLQVLPADPRGRQPRRAVARPRRRRHRLHRLRPLARAGRDEVRRRRRLRRGVGRHRLAAARTAARVDRGARARHRARPGRRVDGAGAGAPGRPDCEGRDRRGARGGLRRVRARTSCSWSMPRRSSTGTRSRPYDGRELTGVVRSTLLAGEPVDRAVPRGRLLRREEGRSSDALEEFNGAARRGDRAAATVPRHAALVRQLVDGRPYASVDELVAEAEAAASRSPSRRSTARSRSTRASASARRIARRGRDVPRRAGGRRNPR